MSCGKLAANIIPLHLKNGDFSIEFVPKNDKIRDEKLVREDVKEILLQMYLRAKKRGRPSKQEEEEKSAA